MHRRRTVALAREAVTDAQIAGLGATVQPGEGNDLLDRQPGDVGRPLRRARREVRFDRRRKIGVTGEKIAIGQPLGQQHVHHRAGQRPVGAGFEREMHVSLRRRRRTVGIDDHQLGTALAPCLLCPVHEVDLRMHRITAPDDDQVRMHDFTRVDTTLDADAGKPARVGQRDAEGLALPRPAGQVAEPSQRRALHQPHRAGVVVRPDGLRPVLPDRLLQAFGKQVERVVPREPFKTSVALGADPPQRMQQALGVVDALGVARHLGTDHAVGIRLRRATDTPDPFRRFELDV